MLLIFNVQYKQIVFFEFVEEERINEARKKARKLVPMLYFYLKKKKMNNVHRGHLVLLHVKGSENK